MRKVKTSTEKMVIDGLKTQAFAIRCENLYHPQTNTGKK